MAAANSGSVGRGKLTSSINIHDVWGFAHDHVHLYPEIGYNKKAFANIANDRGTTEEKEHVKLWTEAFYKETENE